MKFILTIIISFLLVVTVYIFINIPDHSYSENKYKNYLWLFKYNERDKIDFGNSLYTKNDVFNELWYNLDIKGVNLNIDYVLNIWEFKNHKDLTIEDIQIYNDEKLDEVFYDDFEFIDDISIKEDYNFQKGVNIALSKDANIKFLFDEPNYKGFYGATKGYSLTNSNKESQIFFEKNKWNDLILLLIYKKGNSFYLITVQSKTKYFDHTIIDMFDLK